MKKFIILITLMTVVLTGCGSMYEESTEKINDSDLGNGYFVEIREWGGTFDDSTRYSIVYAKDTKVKYLVMKSQYRSGIIPLYNKDGSLQIYKGEK